MSVCCPEDARDSSVPHVHSLEGAPVLVVEDEPDLAEEIRLELEANGHPVRVAATAADGLSEARAGWASVFVFDRMLQGDDGLSIVETLRGEGVRLRCW